MKILLIEDNPDIVANHYGFLEPKGYALDLARNGHGLLWFLPLLMAALVLSTILRVRQESNRALALASIVCGLITLYLMNRERLRVHDESSLISAQLTGWFWLGFISTFAVVVSGIAMLLTRRRGP